MPGTNPTPYLDDSPRLGSPTGPGGTTVVLNPKWVTLTWTHSDANPAGSLRAFRLVIYTGADPNDSTNYVVPPVEVPATYLSVVVPVMVEETTTVNAAVQALYYNGNESAWRTIAGSVVIDPDTVNLQDLAGVTAVQDQLDNITSDDVLSTAEKSYFNLLYSTLVQEQTSIDNQANLYSTISAVASAKVNYDNALSALVTYLGTLSPSFGDVTQDTPLGTGGGATMRAAFALVFSTRETLLAAIAAQQTDGINTVLTDIEGIQNDGILSRNEKPGLISRYDSATGQKDAATSRAQSLGVDYAQVAGAYANLTDFLGALLPNSTAWRDTTTDTVLPDATTLGTLWATFDTELTKLMLAIQSARRNLDFVIEVPISLSSIPTSVAGGWSSYSQIRDGAKILLAAQTDPTENAVYISTDTTASGAVNSLPSTSAKTGSGTYTSGGLDRNANTTDYETLTGFFSGGASVTYSGWSGAGTAGTLTFVADITNDAGELPAEVTVSYSVDGGINWTLFSGGLFDSPVAGHAVTLTAALTGVVQSQLRVRISCPGSRTKVFDPETGIWGYVDTSLSSALLRAVYFASTGSSVGKLFTKSTNLDQGETYMALYGTRANYDMTVVQKTPTNVLTLGFSPTPATPSAWGTIYGTLADQADLVAQLDRKQNITGFDDPTAVTVTYNSTNRTITLTGTFVARHNGNIVTALTNGWVSAAHTATGGAWYLYWDGSAFVWSQSPWTFDKLMIAFAYYNATTPANSFAIREVHGHMDALVHEELHNTTGTYYISGGDLGGYTLNSSTAAERRPSVAATVVKDEDLKSTITALADNGPYTRLTLTSTGTSTFTTGAADIVPLSGAQPYYNEFSGGNWVQTLLPATKYMTVWLVAVPTTADAGSLAYRYLWMQGQDAFDSLSAAQADTFGSMNLGQLTSLFTEFVVIGKIILRNIASDWQLIQVDKLTGTRMSSIGSTPGNYLSAVVATSPIIGTGVAADPLALAYTPINKAGDTGIGNLSMAALTATAASITDGLGTTAISGAGLYINRVAGYVSSGAVGQHLYYQSESHNFRSFDGLSTWFRITNTGQALFYSNPVSMGALTATTGSFSGNITLPKTAKIVNAGNGAQLLEALYTGIGEAYSSCALVMGTNIKVDPADTVSTQIRIKSTHASIGYGYWKVAGNTTNFYGAAGSVVAGDIITPTEIFRAGTAGVVAYTAFTANAGLSATTGAFSGALSGTTGAFSGKVQATGYSTTWGNTSGANTGALNCVQGTSTAATWALSASSGGVFRAGIQVLDAGGTVRYYEGTNYFQFAANTLYATFMSTTGISSSGGVSGATGSFANGIGIGPGQAANSGAGIWLGTGGLTSVSATQYGIVCTVVPSTSATAFTAIYAQAAVPAGGALTTAYGLRVLDIAKTGAGTGTTVNNYGVYVNAMTGGTTGNYAIYTNAGSVRFGGITRIEDTTASTSSSSGSLTTAGGLGVAGNIYAASAIFGPNYVADGNSGVAKGLYLRTGNLSRWYINASSSAESGSDAGSPFLLTAYNDAGVGIDVPIAITRAAGGTLTLGRPTYISSSAASSGTTSGALIVVGGVGIGGAVFTGSTITAGGPLFAGTGTDHPGGIYKTASRGLTLQGVTGSVYDFAIYSPAGAVIASVPTGTTSLNITGALYMNSANQTLDRSSNDLRWRYDGTNYGTILHTGNLTTAAAGLQAIVASATAPLVGTIAQRTAYTPATGTTPYWYATDETAPDGLLGTLRQWNGSAWGAAANPQTVTGRVVAGVISAGAIGANALAATLVMTTVITSTGYTAGTSSAAPVGFKLSGNAFTTTYLDGTTDTNCYMEIGGSVNIGGYKAAIIANRVKGNTHTWSSIATHTWTCPEGITSIELTLQGPGGTGGTGTVDYAGGGGGGGAFMKKTVFVTPGVTYTISITSSLVSFSGSGFTTITANKGGNATGSSPGIGGTLTGVTNSTEFHPEYGWSQSGKNGTASRDRDDAGGELFLAGSLGGQQYGLGGNGGTGGNSTTTGGTAGAAGQGAYARVRY